VLIILFTVKPISEGIDSATHPKYGDKYADTNPATDGIRVAGAFLLGAILSGTAGALGMEVGRNE
jgi:hypothetical protein